MSDDSVWGIVALAVLVTIAIIAVIAGAILLPVIVAVVFIVGSTYGYFHSPKYLERKAKEHTFALYEQAKKYQPYSRYEFSTRVIGDLGPFPSKLAVPLDHITQELFELEDFGEVGAPPPICNSIEGARYRDHISAFMARSHDSHAIHLAIRELADIYKEFIWELPRIEDDEGELTTVPLHSVIQDLPGVVQRLILGFYRQPIEDAGLFKRLRSQFDAHYTRQKETMPRDYKGDNLLWDYLGGTPLLDLFNVPVAISLPASARFEHTYVLAQTGHGKTTLLEYLISRDLDDDCCVIVIDSQRQLIPKLAELDLRPSDIGWITPHNPLALNIFDFGGSGRDKAVAVELLKFVLAGLMEAPLTSKQDLIFNFAIQIMFAIPGANIQTFLQLLSDPKPLEPFIGRLDGAVRDFYEREFKDEKLYRDTKREISWRVWSLLKNPVFGEMFGARENKVSMQEEMGRKLVLIDTDANLLQGGSAIFGRFFIAMILHEAQRRFSSRERPVYVYLDEAHETIDENIDRMLAQARKARIGITLSHQYIDQIDSQKTIQSVLTNTSTKFVGNVSHKDARALAPELRTTPEFFREQKKGNFAVYIKGETDSAISLSVPFGAIDRLPKSRRALDTKRYAPSEPIRGEDFVMEPPEEPPPPPPEQQKRPEPPRAAPPSKPPPSDDIDTGASDTL
ncbi:MULTISPECIES: hypothetical protein [Hyphomicrobiales]|uniref:hypothetical protein n=1 Tax=Hyphomicrobiales TaxID=356 RepID=UPI00329742DE